MDTFSVPQTAMKLLVSQITCTTALGIYVLDIKNLENYFLILYS